MKIYNVVSIPRGLQEVECNCQEEYFSGYTAGYEDGKNKGFQSGYTSGVTDGIEEGKEEQKSLLVYTAITENGTYSREDGYNEIFVDVPTYSGASYESGYTDGYESGYTQGSEDGYESGSTDGFNEGYPSGYTDGYDSGYTDGQASVDCQDFWNSGYTSGYTDGYDSGRTDGYQDGWQPGYESGYTDGVEAAGGDYASGYTDGFEHGYESGSTDGFNKGYESGSTDGFQEGHTSGVTDGENAQKAKLSAITITENGNYTRGDGYSAITVSVPQTGYTPQDMQDSWNSGYTSGVTDGENTQKAKLTSTAFTQNGTYTRADGWSAVTVNVSGYTQQDLDNAFNSGWTNGYNSGYTDGCNVDYSTPLTMDIISGGTLRWRANIVNTRSATPLTIEYRINDGSWTNITSTTAGTPINVSSHDTIQFRGNNDTYVLPNRQYDLSCVNQFVMEGGTFNLRGNIMSMLTSTNYATLRTFSSELEVFGGMFYGNTGLIDASGLLLPATALTIDCYREMFYGCTNLTGTPVLPATTLAGGCYDGMFRNCTSLTTAPALPATTLATGCYGYMFWGCSNLTTAPALPATTLVNNCYKDMFYGCTSLTTAPELPATTLVQGCYWDMFRSCLLLNHIKCLATDMSATNCTTNWVDNVASTGTFVKDPNAEWTTGDNGIPENWTVQDAQ